MTVIAAYDIREDSRRARLAALLQGYGDRVQKSVFVVRVSEGDLDDIRQFAAEELDLDTDSFYLFRQCHTCWEALGCVGQAQTPEKVLFWAVL